MGAIKLIAVITGRFKIAVTVIPKITGAINREWINGILVAFFSIISLVPISTKYFIKFLNSKYNVSALEIAMVIVNHKGNLSAKQM